MFRYILNKIYAIFLSASIKITKIKHKQNFKNNILIPYLNLYAKSPLSASKI